jgi:hypothetical protein
MTIGTGTPQDPIIVVDWSGFYGWGIWRTARHYGAKDSDPLATGSLDGVVGFAYRSLKPTSKGWKRPLLAHWENGRWRAKHFIDHHGSMTPISPNSTPDAREKQRDRYDRCHYNGTPWWDGSPDPPEHEVHPRTIPVDDKGRQMKLERP